MTVQIQHNKLLVCCSADQPGFTQQAHEISIRNADLHGILVIDANGP
jgi:hypothetical protein